MFSPVELEIRHAGGRAHTQRETCNDMLKTLRVPNINDRYCKVNN